MDAIKVTLNVILPGRVMYSKHDSKKLVETTKTLKTGVTKKIKKLVWDNDKTESFNVSVIDEGNSRQNLIIVVRGNKPATQCLNINEQSYNYMVSKECPYFSKPKEWATLSKKKRLEAHLADIAESLGGKVSSYNVYDD
jgi:hypothetical protein